MTPITVLGRRDRAIQTRTVARLLRETGLSRTEALARFEASRVRRAESRVTLTVGIER